MTGDAFVAGVIWGLRKCRKILQGSVDIALRVLLRDTSALAHAGGVLI